MIANYVHLFFRPADGNPSHPAHRAVWSLSAPGSTRNDWSASRPCLLPPMAVKSKPPAVRMVVDSGKDFA